MLAFFDEMLGELQPHHQFADLRAGEREFAFLGIAPRLESPRLLEEHPLPGLELMGRHLALARHRVERLTAQEPQDELRLPRGRSSAPGVPPLPPALVHCQESWSAFAPCPS